ncbi:MAG: glycosyltransferase family 2 protein, partial [Desulfuromonadales bacterium]|nr:glycosyltransferase family 2 protein [Desulfuromonadales bacterium]
MHISVVIPVYKAEACLHELYRRLKSVLETITTDFEIILVEDCGGDRSWAMIGELAQADPRVKGIQFSRNFGQHYGITAGLDHCHGDWVVVMDCDLQDQPEEIPRLYAKAQEGFEVVLARRGRRQHALLKRISSRLFYATLNYLADMRYDAEVGNFRIVSRKVAEAYRQMRENLRFFGGLVDWMGFPTASINVDHAERFAGETSYSFAKLWKLGIETIIAYSDKPLRLAIRFGFLLSVGALLYSTRIIYEALQGSHTVLGWSSLMASIYFLGGIIISLLGIIGLYLGKTFDETKRRPLYIVNHKTY